jgi:hypothetical protein
MGQQRKLRPFTAMSASALMADVEVDFVDFRVVPIADIC